MKSWEYSKNIIAFFQSYPEIFSQTFSFYSTVISKDLEKYRIHHSSYDNPEVKDDPYEITEEVIQLLNYFKDTKITVDLITNIDYINSERHQRIFEDYIVPLLKAVADHCNVTEFRESGVDVFSLQGLFDQKLRTIIPDVVNTVIYV